MDEWTASHLIFAMNPEVPGPNAQQSNLRALEQRGSQNNIKILQSSRTTFDLTTMSRIPQDTDSILHLNDRSSKT